MNYDEEVYEKQLQNFELLRNIIRQNSSEDQLRRNLDEYRT